jgi:hypothetical protein
VRLFLFSLLCLTAVLFAVDPVEFRVGSFSFERPEGWNWIVPTSSMRKAQLAVPNTKGEAAEVNFFHFGAGQGGGVKANVDRWFGQFQNATNSQKESNIAGTVVVLVEAKGTFLSGMPGGPTTPKEDYALRGAILRDDSNGDVFVKMTGPASLLESAKEAFDKMVADAAKTKR